MCPLPKSRSALTPSRRTHNILRFHRGDQVRRPVVSDPQPPLEPRYRALAGSDDQFHRLRVQLIVHQVSLSADSAVKLGQCVAGPLRLHVSRTLTTRTV